MLTALRIVTAATLGWAALALVVQVFRARGGGRRDYSEPAGDPRRGLRYNFTTAMSPAHKESARLHPLKFVLGLVLHAGVFVALLGVILLLVSPPSGAQGLVLARPILALGLVAGVALLCARAGSMLLRTLSTPDDYLASLATCGLLAFALAAGQGLAAPTVLLVYAALLFVYFPLGKLRHAVFFFVVRADYGRRLGYRGVYPPARAGTE